MLILSLTTKYASLESEPIGQATNYRFVKQYKNIIDACDDGWELISPPLIITNELSNLTAYGCPKEFVWYFKR
jgi:hypothetical protein